MRLYVILALSVLIAAPAALAASARHFDATYTATVRDVPAGMTSLQVWIPLPVSRGGQTIESVSIDSPYKWQRHHDPVFGDDYVYSTLANPPAGDLAVKIRFSGTRREVTTASLAERS
ncbi:MAG: hypothetical protein ACJ74H_16545, partial [Thermoanaerobaculia bacterium]